MSATILILAPVVALALLLGGCGGGHVYKIGVSQEETNRDAYNCDREVRALGTDWHRCMAAKGYSATREEAEQAWRRQQEAQARGTSTPGERLTLQRRPLTQALLRRIDSGECPQLAPCLNEYEASVRRLATAVGYTVISNDELLFRAAREIALAADDGTITQDQAVNRLLALDAQIEEIYRALQIERARRQ